MTAHNGIVYDPSKKSPFTIGLPYVAISRATDLDKVALLSPIRTDHFITDKFKALLHFIKIKKSNLITMKKYRIINIQ